MQSSVQAREPRLLRVSRLLFCGLIWIAGPVFAVHPEQQRTEFLRAERLIDQGRPADARQVLPGLEDYPLKPYLLYQILRREPGSDGEMAEFLARYGQTRHAAALRKFWLGRLAQREDWAGYIRAYRETDDAELQCNRFFALHRLGSVREAFAGAARLWTTVDDPPAACERLFSVWQASPEFAPDHVWQRFGRLLSRGKIKLAAALRSLVPAAELGLADFWLRVHDEPTRVGQCDGWTDDRPLIGRIFAHGIDRLAGQEPLAAQTLWSLRRSEFPMDGEEQTRLDRRLALALATQRYPQAAAYLNSFPDAEADNPIRTWRVRAALIKQDWPRVLIAIERLKPDEQQENAWRYWRARALEALGQQSSATELFRRLAIERDFYGFAAADRLHQGYGLSFEPGAVPEPDLQRVRAGSAFRVIEEFRTLGRLDEARKEWIHVIRSMPKQDLPAAAKIAQSWAWDRIAILTAAQAEKRDDLSLRFPMGYSERVLAEARKFAVDPAMVFGIIRRESAFDPAAKSSAGALGLMQIMPGTGEQMARQLGEQWRSESGLLDPDLNLRYGTAYLRSLIARFQGRWVLAAAAYNAGPGRIDRWLPAQQPVPADIWIETIPFAETRQYVSAVLTYAVIYRWQAGEQTSAISDFLGEIGPGGRYAPKADRPEPVLPCQRNDAPNG